MCLIFVLFAMGAVFRDQETASMAMGLNEVTGGRVCNREEVGPKTIQCSLSAVGLGTAHSDISAFKTPFFSAGFHHQLWPFSLIVLAMTLESQDVPCSFIVSFTQLWVHSFIHSFVHTLDN